jgi:hypothetical protein
MTYSAAINSSQGEVLHIAGPDLNDIGVIRNQVETLIVQRLSDNPQAEAIAYLSHDLQAVFAHALKGVRRSARFIGASTKELGPRAGNLLRYCECLLPGFDRARSCDYCQVKAANGRIGTGEGNDRVLLLYITTDQLVGLRDPDHLGHAGEILEIALIHGATVAGDADGGALRAGHGMGTEA